MARANRYTPTMVRRKPHFRVSLDTTRNVNTGLSQHELLFNLNKNKGALVYYACPMIFDKTSLYEIDVDLDTLRLADLNDCQSSYLDNDNHYIYFNDKTESPVWCSEPVVGKAISGPAFLRHLVEDKITAERAAQTSQQLLDMFTDFESAGLSPESKIFRDMFKPTFVPMLADSLTIVRISRNREIAPEPHQLNRARSQE